MPAYNDTNFRTLFTAFSNTTTYPQVTLQMYWTVASDYISTNDNPCNNLNGASLQLALDCLCAHIATLFTQDAANVEEGGAPGQAEGITTSSSIGAISVSQLPPPVDNDPWRFWMNQTSYGQQLLALLSLKAVGGFYVGGLPERQGFRKADGVFF
jgi:hypothetical protein